MTTAQDAYAVVRSTYLVPALRELAFRVRSRKRAVRGDSVAGWVVVELGGNRRNTSSEGDWSVGVYLWPPGTWEWRCIRSGTSRPEPDSSVPPVYASIDRLYGRLVVPRPDTVTLVSDMGEQEIEEAAQRLLAHLRLAVAWVEDVLASGQVDDHTRPDAVLGAASTTGTWTAGRRALLESSTVQAQRGEWRWPEEWLARWRQEAELPPVPFPRILPLRSRPHPLDRFPSPRAAFDAGHGTSYATATGGGQPPGPVTRDDLPDAEQLAAWAAVATTLPEVALADPPDWLPWWEWVLPPQR